MPRILRRSPLAETHVPSLARPERHASGCFHPDRSCREPARFFPKGSGGRELREPRILGSRCRRWPATSCLPLTRGKVFLISVLRKQKCVLFLAHLPISRP